MDPQNQTPTSVEFKKRFSPKMIIGLLILVLVVGGVLGIAFAGFNSQNNTEEETKEQTPVAFNTPYSLLYGTWTNEDTRVNSYDLATGKEYTLTTLPLNIKKITLVNDQNLVYIANTDGGSDHGTLINMLDLTTGNETTLYNSVNGYGIDDYQISPNGQYLATWEVKLSQDNILQGGMSKVVSLNLTSPQNTYTIVEESPAPNVPMHYPVAVGNDGKIFLDRFLPNSGAGWAYGMSTSNFTGGGLTPIPSMQNGTYGTQPRISPDGTLLIFSSYSGSDGATTEDGFRKAIFSSNTLATLNTSTLTKSTLPNVDQQLSYIKASWDSNDTALVKAISSNADETGSYIYNLSSSTAEYINTEENETALAKLPGNLVILGRFNPDLQGIEGNLGTTYSVPYIGVSLLDLNTNENNKIPVNSNFIQFIDMVENTSPLTSAYKEDKLARIQPISESSSPEKNPLSLQGFVFKEELEPTRTKQQSDPPPSESPTQPTSTPTRPTITTSPTRGQEVPEEEWQSTITPTPKPDDSHLPTCDSVADKAVASQCGSRPSDEAGFANPSLVSTYNNCRSAAVSAVYDGMGTTCSDSPLYLYGPANLKVEVNLHTQISNESIQGKQHNSTTTYNFILGEKGIFYQSGKSYDSLAFDYTPAKKPPLPFTGEVVKKENIEEKVKEYSQKLGLNQKETSDLIKDIKSKTNGNYIFLSFYDQSNSKLLLPITFSPNPDTYINYVFYVRSLSNPQELGYTPKKPSFPRFPHRGEFTAVEISVIGN